MDENKFWLIVCAIFASVLIALVLAIVIYDMHENSLLAASPDPVALKCAMSTSSASDACVIAASRK